MHGIVAAGRAPDRPRRAGVARFHSEGVVGTLAEGLADRVDRRQVEHVESHGCHGGQASRGSTEGPAGERSVGPLHDSDRTREELVPGAVAGALAFDFQLVPVGERIEARDRAILHGVQHGRRRCLFEPVGRGDGLVGHEQGKVIEQCTLLCGALGIGTG
jgi:hypothetical protein